MDTTKLSSKGQVIIPKTLRDAYRWETGQEFAIIDVGDGILLQPKRPFPLTRLEDVVGSLPYDGPAKTIEEMEQAIAKGIKAQRMTEQIDDNA
jgi:AbrB family looped-hinge helix DNA binding protein